MQDLLCTPVSTFGLEMPSLEIVIVCAVPLMMMLQQWASKRNSDMPATRLAPSQNETTGENAQDMPPVVGNNQAPRQDVIETLAGMPQDIQSMVAQQLSNSDISNLSSVCHASHQSFWNSDLVWLALGARDNLCLGRSGVAKFTRDEFRRATFRIDCADLAALADAEVNIFGEASHVLKGLTSKDMHEIQLLCRLVGSALESTNFATAGAAEAFLRKAHLRTDLFSRQDLEMLDNAYDYALLQHNLEIEIMEEHWEDLETQMRSVERQVCDDHRALILDQ